MFYAMFDSGLAEKKGSLEISCSEYENLFVLFNFIYPDAVSDVFVREIYATFALQTDFLWVRHVPCLGSLLDFVEKETEETGWLRYNWEAVEGLNGVNR